VRGELSARARLDVDEIMSRFSADALVRVLRSRTTASSTEASTALGCGGAARVRLAPDQATAGKGGLRGRTLRIDDGHHVVSQIPISHWRPPCPLDSERSNRALLQRPATHCSSVRQVSGASRIPSSSLAVERHAFARRRPGSRATPCGLPPLSTRRARALQHSTLKRHHCTSGPSRPATRPRQPVATALPLSRQSIGRRTLRLRAPSSIRSR
jgi:hypothetical protein